MKEENNIYLKPREVADYLRVTRGTVSRLVKAGVLPPPIVLSERVHRFRREDIEAIMRGETVSRDVVEDRRAAILRNLRRE